MLSATLVGAKYPSLLQLCNERRYGLCSARRQRIRFDCLLYADHPAVLPDWQLGSGMGRKALWFWEPHLLDEGPGGLEL